ncbi:DUF4244 domain-containing protein [Mobilicoccus pelagius]|uniref:DUF4244 domain-containing protein n=1 Tax=Mobilicoccus pelagius NBRC 104925 TaxID=1089455 RepID=H5UNW6_9MICO|nr:DUF4244 domain-containing protein [Mobilicoccus pelagius]GAB47424.1 hypothetical protein MOPEL_011_00060 [Mobilicoccus pelagius NBRC 104925]
MSTTLVRTHRHLPARVAHGARRRIVTRWSVLRAHAESGMSTAEYAVGTLAACTFAAVLIAVVKSGAVSSALSKIITSALAIGS